MCCLAHLVLGRPTIKRNVEAGMGMGGNGNELSGGVRECEWFFKCVNIGNGNGKDLAGMGGIENTENHSRTSLLLSRTHTIGQDLIYHVPTPDVTTPHDSS